METPLKEVGIVRVDITRLSRDSELEDRAHFWVHDLTPLIRNVTEALQGSTSAIFAARIGTVDSVQEKVYASEIAYVEYRERETFFYTQSSAYAVRQSLSAFLDQMPSFIVQIAKGFAVNVYYVRKLTVLLNGNLAVLLSTGDKLVVSRRYAKALQDAMREALT